MQDLIRKLPGVVSARVGYTGGDTPNATYRNHGTHAEGTEIVFDTAETSYRCPKTRSLHFRHAAFCDERRYTDCPMEVFGSLEPAGGPDMNARTIPATREIACPIFPTLPPGGYLG
jgi:hypothetical protein